MMNGSYSFQNYPLPTDEYIRQLKIQRAALEKSMEFNNFQSGFRYEGDDDKVLIRRHILYFRPYYPLGNLDL